VESDLVAVGVGEGEGSTEGAVNGCGDDGVTVGGEGIVNGLDVCGVEPDRGADAGLSDGCEIGARNDVAERERDRLGLEDDGAACERMRPRYCSTGPRRSPSSGSVGREAVERLRSPEVAVEVRMLAGMTETEQSDAFRILQSMTRSLRDANNRG
jgi:hypothetical protein